MKFKTIAFPVIYIFLFLIGSASLQSCKKLGGSSGLSAARQLKGTWKTTVASTFYYYSDACGTYSRVAKTQIGMQWNITETGDNTVDIELYKTGSSSVQLLVSQNCALYVPLVTPVSLKGTISSSQLTIKDSKARIVGSFSITTDNLAGDFSSAFDKYCGIYCTGMDTDSKAVILVKQK